MFLLTTYRLPRIEVSARLPVGDDVLPPDYASSEEGNVSNLVVVVNFGEVIISPTDNYLLGATIKVNAVGVNIVSATLMVGSQTVHYLVTSGEEADANDTVTWEYSEIIGDIEDQAGNDLGDVSITGVINNVGMHMRYDHQANGMQLIPLGIL
jgi:hypothetical protein